MPKKTPILLWSGQLSRSPPKRGRPPKNEKNKTILLRESTFNLRNQKTIDLGFQRNTNSEFGEVSCLHACKLSGIANLHLDTDSRGISQISLNTLLNSCESKRQLHNKQAYIFRDIFVQDVVNKFI